MANCCEHGECDRILTLGELKGMFDLSQIYVDGQLVSFNSGTSASWAANSGKCVTYKDMINGSYYSGSTEIKMGLSGTTPTPFYFPTTGETTDGSGFDITTGYSNVTYAYSGDNIDIKEGEGCCSAITNAVRTVDLKIIGISGTPASMSIRDVGSYECYGQVRIEINGNSSTTTISANTGNECSITSSTTPAVNVSATTLSYIYGSGEKCAISDNELTSSSSSTTTFRSKNVVISDGMKYMFNNYNYWYDENNYNGYTEPINQISAKVPTTRISASVETNTDVILTGDTTFSGYTGESRTYNPYYVYTTKALAKESINIYVISPLNFSDSVFQQDNMCTYYCGGSTNFNLITGCDVEVYYNGFEEDGDTYGINVYKNNYGKWVVETDDFQNSGQYYDKNSREIVLGFEIGCKTFYMCLQQKANRVSDNIIWNPCCDAGGSAYVGEKLICG